MGTRRFLVGMGVGGLLAAGALAAPLAHAMFSHTARTEISWAGTECIGAWSAIPFDRSQKAYATVCPGSGTYVLNEVGIFPGDYFGVGIPLTGQTFIRCVTWLDGVLQYEDEAFGALGSGEANCLRQAG